VDDGAVAGREQGLRKSLSQGQVVMIGLGGEAVAAGVYMTFWFPEGPVWIWSLGFAAVLHTHRYAC